MALILAIETATEVCSVALIRNKKIEAIRESHEKNAHAANITLFIQSVLTTAGAEIKEIDAAAVSAGPGSYTGLRIGTSAAKGICYANDKPLIAINTLKAMAYGAIEVTKKEGTYCALISSRASEIYAACWDQHFNQIREIEAADAGKYVGTLAKSNNYFLFGSGTEKLPQELPPHVGILEHFSASASHFSSIAEEIFLKNEFENIAYFTPFYLKSVSFKKI